MANIIETLTAIVVVYYFVVKSFTDTIIMFSPIISDNNLLKEDLMSVERKNIAAFAFALAMLLLSYLLYFFECPIFFIIALFVYLIWFFKRKQKKKLTINHDDAEWYLYHQLTDGRYIFKKLNSSNHMKIFPLEEVLENYKGYKEINTKGKKKWYNRLKNNRLWDKIKRLL